MKGPMWFVILLLVGAMQAITAHWLAPGDEHDVCVEKNSGRHHKNELVLMSSYYYKDLLRPKGPWTVTDESTSSYSFSTWKLSVQSRDNQSMCNRVLYTCATRLLGCPQDNWLITQFINNTMRQKYIYIRVQYFMPNTIDYCKIYPAMGMYVLQTNNSNILFTASDVSSTFVTASVVKLTDTVGNYHYNTRIVPIKADLSTTGLYVALRDRGACFYFIELTVFYRTLHCDAVSLDLGAKFSEMGFAGVTSTGVCFDKMAISLNPLEDRFNATCTVTSISSRGTDRLLTKWTINDNALQQCVCQPGYVFTNRTTTSQCQEYDCTSVADKLMKQLDTLTRLNYNAIRSWLFATSVITSAEKRIIDRKIGKEKMKYLITEIIIPSLKLNSCFKYRGFLDAMENSDDGDIKNAAKRFGGSKSVQNS